MRTDDTRPASRAAARLKASLIATHGDEFAAGLEWAAGDPTIERAAAMITGARRRFVLGAATSFTYASLLAAKLSNSVAQVTLIDGTIVRPLDVLADVRTSDVLVVVSLRRYRRYTLDAAIPFAQAGGSLVVVTDSDDNPLVDHAAVAVVAPTPSTASAERAADLGLHPETPSVSPPVIALVLDLLATLVSTSAKGAGRRLAERERLAGELGLYRDGAS